MVPGIYWYANVGNDSASHFNSTPGTIFEEANGGFQYVACHDVTDDGFPDVVWSEASTGVARWALNRGVSVDPTGTAASASQSPSTTTSTLPTDCPYFSGSVYSLMPLGACPGAFSVEFRDVNKDDIIDVVGACTDVNTIWWSRNRLGAANVSVEASFESAVPLTTAAVSVRHADVGDFDNDGLPVSSIRGGGVASAAAVLIVAVDGTHWSCCWESRC